MILTLEESAMSPVEIRVKWADGKAETLKLPRLEMEDFGKWLAEYVESDRNDILAGITKTTKPSDRAALQLMAKHTFATIGELRQPVTTADGANRVIKMSLAKIGIEGDKASQFLKLLGSGYKFDLAATLSTLWQVPYPADEAEEANPNPQTPPASDAEGESPPRSPQDASPTITSSTP